MTREALDRILPIPMASPYLPALLASTGLPVRSIPVEREVRPAGKSAYSEWARLRLAYNGLSAAWKLKRRRVEQPPPARPWERQIAAPHTQVTSRRAYRLRDLERVHFAADEGRQHSWREKDALIFRVEAGLRNLTAAQSAD